MRTLKKQLNQNLAFFLFSSLLTAVPAMAVSDLEAQQEFAKARAKNSQEGVDHAAHAKPVDESQEFRGVFYGFLPCNDDCPGIKTTLSLKQKHNYLLVTQYAKESTREYYERGKYNWDDENRTVVLTPTKGGTTTRRYYIENEGTLILLKEDGTRMTEDADRYILRRGDTVKSREVHIH